MEQLQIFDLNDSSTRLGRIQYNNNHLMMSKYSAGYLQFEAEGKKEMDLSLKISPYPKSPVKKSKID